MSLATYCVEDLAEQLAAGGSLRLRGPEGRHAITVKRVREGEEIMLISGTGTWARARVDSLLGKEEALLSALDHGEAPEPRPRVTVAQALPKSERSELAIDLGTQAGADAFLPWQAEHCVAKWSGAKKVERGLSKWRHAALAAAKQSRRRRVPTIGDVHSTAQLVEAIRDLRSRGGVALLLEGDAGQPIAECDLDVPEVLLVVGPEGGISPAERAELGAAGAQEVRLGPEVLRTASASMVALAAIGVLTQRW